MKTTTTAPAAAATKDKLDEPTMMLFYLVSFCPYLAQYFGVDLADDGRRMNFADRPRPWLVKRPGKTELSFDPDLYAKALPKGYSEGENHLHLFVLNLWNPAGAREKGWTFDLFAAAMTLDKETLENLCRIISAPVWP